MLCVFTFLLYRPLTKEDKLSSKIQDLKEKNASLSKVNSELQEELKTVSRTAKLFTSTGRDLEFEQDCKCVMINPGKMSTAHFVKVEKFCLLLSPGERYFPSLFLLRSLGVFFFFGSQRLLVFSSFSIPLFQSSFVVVS